MTINVSKLLKIVFNLNFCQNTENSKEEFKHHNNWILALFSHLVPVYLVQKNGGKDSKKRHLCDLSGSFKGSKKIKKKDTQY